MISPDVTERYDQQIRGLYRRMARCNNTNGIYVAFWKEVQVVDE